MLSDKEKENALNEVRILASIQHPNIISYKEAFIEEQTSNLWVIMEFADAGDAFQLMSRLKDEGRTFTEEEIWRILIQTVNGLKQLHDWKIMHRDLKSANIFLFRNGDVKLGDLNVSKIMNNSLEYTQTGTPYYASPEVWKNQPYNAKSDIWSLGCVVYELICQKPPFDAKSMNDLFKVVIRGKFEPIPETYSAGLQRIINWMIKLSPSKRPSCNLILNDSAALKWSSKLFEGKEQKPAASYKTVQIELLARYANSSTLMNTIQWWDDMKTLSSKLPSKAYSDDIHIQDSNNNSIREYSKMYSDYISKAKSIKKSTNSSVEK